MWIPENWSPAADPGADRPGRTAASDAEAHGKEVIPGRPRGPGKMMQAQYYDPDAHPVAWQQWRRSGYSHAGYADAVRHGRHLNVITFSSGIAAGQGPAEPLIFCACAGTCGPGCSAVSIRGRTRDRERP